MYAEHLRVLRHGYRQWQSLGAQVRRGERGTIVVFYRAFDHDEEDQEERAGGRLVARASRVFNGDQVDGWNSPAIERPALAGTAPRVDGLVAGSGAKVRHGAEHACYRVPEDLIELPDRERFHGTATSSPTEAYYATMLHELVHWSGAAHRLARVYGERFGDDKYGAEELVAELGAAFLCADLAVSNAPRADHAAYLSRWLEILKQDSRAIFTAARLANEAATYLLRFEPAQRSLFG